MLNISTVFFIISNLVVTPVLPAHHRRAVGPTAAT